MNHMKDQLLAAIERRAIHRVGRLATEMIDAQPQEKEAILAERDYCLWLAEICDECW
jgi:hypothetical protein